MKTKYAAHLLKITALSDDTHFLSKIKNISQTFVLFLLLNSLQINSHASDNIDLSKETVKEMAGALDQIFQDFECNYNLSTMVLPGWKDVFKKSTNYRVNKDGYNDIYNIVCKRSGDRWYVKKEDLFDEVSHDINEKHFDGQLFWESRSGGDAVVIASNKSYLPLLYENLVTSFERNALSYSDTASKNTLKKLMMQEGSEVQIIKKSPGLIELRIIVPNKNHPIAGMNRLYSFIISTTPDFIIYSYSYGVMYKQGDVEHIFKPFLQISYSDFQSVSSGVPKIPWRIQLTEYGPKNHDDAKNIEDLIERDNGDDTTPTKWSILTLKSFNLHPIFNTGEIQFNYPAGTHVFDQYAHRSYIIGDTLEALRKKVKPTNAPSSSELPKSQNPSEHQ